MPRKSAEALSIVPRLPNQGVPEPSDLTASELALWREIVTSKPSDWFGPDSAPLLKMYVRTVIRCERLALEADGMDRAVFDMLDKEERRALSIATKLRLTQQSRYGARSADRADRKANGGRPWQRES